MKKGQHVMGRDPDYVESLRGGGGSKPQESSNVPQKTSPNKPKKSGWNKNRAKAIAKMVGGAALMGGAALLARRLGGAMGRKMASKSLSLVKAKAKAPIANATKAKSSVSRSVGNISKSGNTNLTNIKSVQKALSNPNHVWDI